MYNPKDKPTQPTIQPPEEPVKKPYEKPAIVYHAPLEAVAGVCTDPPGKAGGGCDPLTS